MKHVLVTGGAGFIGSHVCQRFADAGGQVIAVDNLSRAELIGKSVGDPFYNWEYLAKWPNVERVRGDVRDMGFISELAAEADIIIHTAGQTAVTTSVTNPRTDFEVNLVGTFNVLEGARLGGRKPVVIDCSTNKVYGDNVNLLPIVEMVKRYQFAENFAGGVSLSLAVDHCEHTPYGCSKLAADVYVQDYGRLYGLRTGVFRMSCIYGPRQFGVEDQGWVAWFTIATLLGRPISIYGDGKQVRDVLFITDLLDVMERFVEHGQPGAVYNIGGGLKNTISLLELLEMLEDVTGRRIEITFGPWRPSDQRVYISDISKAQADLGWEPRVRPEEGVRQLAQWVEQNRQLFEV
jgi:CDP-paratose 2-epimerase